MMDDSPMSLKEIPDGGLCLSASLVISENFSMTKVLMERIDPSARWDHIGALGPKRIEIHSKGWMLAASHLMVHESPEEAAQRIAREQQGLHLLEISETTIF